MKLLANSVDPDQTALKEQSDLGHHCWSTQASILRVGNVIKSCIIIVCKVFIKKSTEQ